MIGYADHIIYEYGRQSDMNGNSDFHTLKGYAMMEDTGITYAMEDYLEMICRMSGDFIRIKELSAKLNVTPSAASKMSDILRKQGLINYEKYGYITLTPKGQHLGAFLLRRHDIVHRMLCIVNGSSNELEETEKIEHYLSPRTVVNMEKFIAGYDRMKEK